jgi:hypothetical protein
MPDQGQDFPLVQGRAYIAYRRRIAGSKLSPQPVNS